MQLKYVRHSTLGFVVWPKTDALWHLHVGEMLDRRCKGFIVSAGFAEVVGGEVRCFGESESLGIPSQPGDGDALAAQLGIV